MHTLERSIYDKCNEALVITGSARGGTTILAKIIHSFETVECAFEPPMLFSLFAELPTMESKQWRLLYETYLYEEYLVNALAGRAINCNRADDSSIYRVKSGDEIGRRLSHSLSKQELEQRVAAARLAYKMPDICGYLPKLQHYYPGTQVVAITRQAPEVFSSLLRKGWFNDKLLQNSNIIWPCYRHKGNKVPFWVPEEEAERWLGMDELNRIGYYYVSTNQPLVELTHLSRIRYLDLLTDPESVVARLSNLLELQPGPLTPSIIATISRKSEPTQLGILDGLEPGLKEQVRYYSSLS